MQIDLHHDMLMAQIAQGLDLTRPIGYGEDLQALESRRGQGMGHTGHDGKVVAALLGPLGDDVPCNWILIQAADDAELDAPAPKVASDIDSVPPHLGQARADRSGWPGYPPALQPPQPRLP